MLRMPESQLNVVRPGIALFGVHPCPQRASRSARAANLKPVMRVFNLTKHLSGKDDQEAGKAMMELQEVVDVACVSLRFFVPSEKGVLSAVLSGLYDVHPYEEPVIYVHDVRRGRHRRGADDDNPNRFWNRPTPDWVPEPHQN